MHAAVAHGEDPPPGPHPCLDGSVDPLGNVPVAQKDRRRRGSRITRSNVGAQLSSPPQSTPATNRSSHTHHVVAMQASSTQASQPVNQSKGAPSTVCLRRSLNLSAANE